MKSVILNCNFINCTSCCTAGLVHHHHHHHHHRGTGCRTSSSISRSRL